MFNKQARPNQISLCFNAFSNNLGFEPFLNVLCFNVFLNILCFYIFLNVSCFNAFLNILCFNAFLIILCFNAFLHILCFNEFLNILCINESLNISFFFPRGCMECGTLDPQSYLSQSLQWWNTTSYLCGRWKTCWFPVLTSVHICLFLVSNMLLLSWSS